MENTSVAQQWIYANHIEKHLFLFRCTATEFIRLLPAYSFSRECVYRVVAQQRVYMSQYLQNVFQSVRRVPRMGLHSWEYDVTN
jgi:hypothetical protein